MNKSKRFLLKLKLNFIKSVAPESFDHWNENTKTMTFYSTHSFSPEIKPIIIIKPLWLRAVEFIVYRILK